MLESLLRRIALYAREHARRVFVISAIILALSVAFASRLRVDTEILNMLPQDDPVEKDTNADNTNTTAGINTGEIAGLHNP